MSNFFIQRILTRQFLGANALGDLLSSVADASPANNPGSKIFVQDISGNMTSLVYVNTANLTALAAGVPMYWNSVARTTATDTVASAITNVASSNSAIQSAAGVAINALLGTATPYGWLCCGGYMTGVQIPSSAAAGDKLVLSNAVGSAPTNDVWVRVGVGTAVANPEAVTTLYAVVTSAVQTPTASCLIMGTAGLP